MGEIALRIKTARRRIDVAVHEIIEQGIVISELQRVCKHTWCFLSQVNACHEHLWNVTRRCTECELIVTKKELPVCEECLCALNRATKGDRQATREAKEKGPEERLGNPPLAFRCPKCRKIHILWHDGD